MAKVLPAGANVNLGLGEDPMDRLLKTIQVASQAQGVMNQATLQRDRREAIQLETAQKLMTNQVLRMDAQNPVSIQETKNALLEFKNRFTKENPRLADDIDVFYGTAYNTEIKPIEDTHNRFNQIKDRLYLSLENINKNVQSLPNNTIIASDEMKFKNELGDLFGVLNDYKSNQAMFNQYLPDLNTGLYSDVVAANNLSTTLPKELKGLFDDFEQDLIVGLGKGEYSLEHYNAAKNKYFNASQGQVNSKIIPRISGEINSLWKDYQAPTAFKQAIASGKVPLQDESIENQKNYYDETQGIYYYNGQQLNLGKFEDKTYNEDDPDTWLAAAKINAEKTLQNVYLNDIKDKITEKDALYKEYIQSATGEPSSYATQLTDSQKWPWQEGTSGGLIEDIKLDNNNNKDKDSIQLENLDDFTKLGINVPENLTLDDLNSMEAEITKMVQDESDSGNFVKLQTLTSANFAISNAKAKIKTNETEISETETSESGQTYSSITDFVIDYGKEYGDEVVGTAGAAALAYNIPKVQSIVKSATDYVGATFNLSSDSVVDLYNDTDFKAVGKQLSSTDKKILNLQKKLPKGVKLQDLRPTKDTTVPINIGGKQTSTVNLKQKDDFYRQYKNLLKQKEKIIKNSKESKALLTKIEAGYFPELKADVDIVKPEPFDMKKPPKGAPAEDFAEYNKAKKAHQIKMREYDLNLSSSKAKFRQKMTNFLKNSDQWDIHAIKRTVSSGVRQAYRTPKDLYKGLQQGFTKVGPLDAAIHAWFLLPEDAPIGYKAGASSVALLGTKKLLDHLKTKGISPFLNDKKLTSKLGGWLLKKAPGTLAKMGFKGVAGAAAAGTGIGSVISAGMTAWMLKDMYGLVQQFPELRQMLSESIARQESGELESGELGISNQEETEQPPIINEENWMQPYSQQGE